MLNRSTLVFFMILALNLSCAGGGFQRNLGGGGEYCQPNRIDVFDIPTQAERLDINTLNIEAGTTLAAQSAQVFLQDKLDPSEDRSWILIQFNHSFDPSQQNLFEDRTAGNSELTFGCARGFDLDTPNFNFEISGPTLLVPNSLGVLVEARQTQFSAEWRLEALRAFSEITQASNLTGPPFVTEDPAFTSVEFYRPDPANNPNSYELRIEKDLQTDRGAILILRITYLVRQPVEESE